MSLAAGSTLGSYRISALLGAGGMGEVYRAHDTNLGRDVAIKVLPESVAEDPEALARFEREARAVAALSHPNIRGIYDLVRQDGLVFAVMELLEGETLRAWLIEGPLPQNLIVDYALQAARGLAAAHEKGIVHRDLKPENLFVTNDGFVKILDFGLAKQQVPGLSRGGEETSAPTATARRSPADTAPGVPFGTLDYMSPEQVRGLPVDRRSDIFSFGTVLHEMLTGKRAFRRASVADTMAAITRDEPVAVPRVQPQAPGLESIVRHCLEKRPEDRFQSAKDLAFALAQTLSGPMPGWSSSTPALSRPATAVTGPTPALTGAPAPSPRKLIVLAVLALAIAALATLVLKHRSPSSAPEIRKRIAVLPFENLGAPDQDYFADGVADEVRGKLTSLPSLGVIARGSSTPYRRTSKTPQQIAKELDVSYLLTGTIRWEKTAQGGRVQVVPELVEVKEKGAPEARWQQRFEAELTDVFRLQSDIAARVASELGVALGGADVKRFAEKPTANLDAYDAFLKGQEASPDFARIDRSSLKRAIESYERAVALDPSFALGWASLGRARSVLYAQSTPTTELAAGAREAAEKAVEIAPSRAASHLARGYVEELVMRRHQKALEAYETALRLEPSSPDALSASAWSNLFLGRYELGVAGLRDAVKADPLSVRSRRNLGAALRYLRRLPEARDVYDRVLALAPANLTLIEERAMVSVAEGDLAGARAVIGKAPKDVDPKALVAYFASYFEQGWVLPPDLRALPLRLTPGEFNDKAEWGVFLALSCAQDGNAARARELGGLAAAEFRAQLAGGAEDSARHAFLGLALAFAGHKDEAIREGLRGTELLPVEKDAFSGPYRRHVLARIYILTGEQEKALDTLETLLKVPYFLTPAWLRIDPTFDPLRGNPRFQRLVAGG